ncbi:MAG: hypothetical protein KAI39_11065 [Desulfobulbaceae bacterium]|nr:hypothetical protein [Desulfobulbaceae bacterium]
MSEISAEIMMQLEQAQIALSQNMVAGEGPPVAPEAMASNITDSTFGAAGSGKAKYVLVDHYTASSSRRLWAHAASAWRSVPITNNEEQGLAQVAFAASRVDVWWDSNNKIKIMRCWKIF